MDEAAKRAMKDLHLGGEGDSRESREVRVTDPKTGGQKGSKQERYDLIPPAFLRSVVVHDVDDHGAMAFVAAFVATRDPVHLVGAFDAFRDLDEHPDLGTHLDLGAELARVNEMGSRKYAAYNWYKGYAWSLSLAALCRHVALWADGDPLDGESGLHHLAHAMWHCATLHTFATHAIGTDDLFPTVLK